MTASLILEIVFGGTMTLWLGRCQGDFLLETIARDIEGETTSGVTGTDDHQGTAMPQVVRDLFGVRRQMSSIRREVGQIAVADSQNSAVAREMEGEFVIPFGDWGALGINELNHYEDKVLAIGPKRSLVGLQQQLGRRIG